MLENRQDDSTFGMELQGGADMWVKTQYKINTKLILQHPIWYPLSSLNVLVETGANKNWNAKHTINKQKENHYTPSSSTAK